MELASQKKFNLKLFKVAFQNLGSHKHLLLIISLLVQIFIMPIPFDTTSTTRYNWLTIQNT
jgi:hypothetical protein